MKEKKQAKRDALRYRRILVPLDGFRRAESVLPMVTALANYQEA